LLLGARNVLYILTVLGIACTPIRRCHVPIAEPAKGCSALRGPP